MFKMISLVEAAEGYGGGGGREGRECHGDPAPQLMRSGHSRYL